MNFFKRVLLRTLREARKEEEQTDRNEKERSVPRPIENDSYGEPLNIRIFNANGGKIVVFINYNVQKGQNKETTYLIHSDQNFTESLSKLIAVEELKR